MRSAESVSVRSHKHLSEVNLSFGQFAVLEALYSIGPLCQRDLAGKILRTPRNITMIVDNLEKRGLVRRKRNSADRRFLFVHLSEEGRQLVEHIFPRHIDALVKEMGVLSEDELGVFGRLCRILGKGER